MLGGEAAEEFENVLLRVISVDELLLDSSYLDHCVLADLLCAGQCFFWHSWDCSLLRALSVAR